MAQFSKIDIDLLKRYDVPGPRYTSYPTAPAFSKSFGPDDYRKAIIINNSGDNKSDLSLYLHIPFCNTLCYFCGCNMLVTHNPQKIEGYLNALKKEICMVQSLLKKERKVSQLHFGGGTPSYLNPCQIQGLMEFLHHMFKFTFDSEISVEIDPRGLTFEHMKAFRKNGFNRVSMGIQDFDPVVQKATNRIQPENLTKKAIDWSKELEFKSINVDLIYGLPLQKPESFEKTLDKIIQLSPERIAVFNFAYVPWLKAHQRVIRKEDLPSPKLKLQILKMTIEKLSNAGYVYIGMDHFAKPDDELAIAQKEKTLYRNFQGYSTKSGADLYAFGVSAISQFHNIYAQNTKAFKDYLNKIDKGDMAIAIGYRMNNDDIIRRHVIMRLMCDMEITKSEVEEAFGVNFEEYFASSMLKLKTFLEDGLLEIKKDKIAVKGVGRLVIRNIAMSFDAYIDKLMEEKPVFSRTV